MTLALLLQSSNTLVHLSAVDLVIIVFYFALVLGIGLYLKGQANTGEDFFMAGREMTAWVAGLAFLSANLGSLELMGWAGNSYKYGILAAHWYWIGAIPSMLFLALVMMPFYYVCKTHSVPGYLKLRFGKGAQAISSVSFAFMAAGIFKSIGEAQDKICPKHTVYEPQPETQSTYATLYELYRKIYFEFGNPERPAFGEVLPRLIQIARG